MFQKNNIEYMKLKTIITSVIWRSWPTYLGIANIIHYSQKLLGNLPSDSRLGRPSPSFFDRGFILVGRFRNLLIQPIQEFNLLKNISFQLFLLNLYSQTYITFVIYFFNLKLCFDKRFRWMLFKWYTWHKIRIIHVVAISKIDTLNFDNNLQDEV